MANITKRGDTYRIRVSCGYAVDGKQVIRSTTYKPEPGMSEAAIIKAVNKKAVLFEEECKNVHSAAPAKFETFAKQWFKDYAELKLKKQTVASYHGKEERTYKALGHMRMDRISSLDVQGFITSLVKEDLAPATVKLYVRFVSVIFNYAIKNRILTYNPCTAITYPDSREIKRVFYDVEEAKKLLELLRNGASENMPYLTFFTLAAYMGARRGELLGLEWKDIDFDNDVISINRSYLYSGYYKESYTDTPKTKQSRRDIKVPPHVMTTLKEYKAWQNQQKEVCGDSWIDHDRLFTKWNGGTMYHEAPLKFLNRFCDSHNLRRVNVHSFRHFNASALINSGVDVVTVQRALGHSTPGTTLNIYSHAFTNSQTKAMEAIASVLDL